MDKTKIIVVCGPTASGKTELAIKLAKEFNGELVNFDSRQIYKYLDIGTNKGEVKEVRSEELEMQNKAKSGTSYAIRNTYNRKKKQLTLHLIEKIRIHLLSFLEPDERFSAFEFAQLAQEIIADIVRRGKLPILVGGTGFYLDALLGKIDISEQELDIEFKESIEKMDLESLRSSALKTDEVKFLSLNESDRNNPYRLQRFILKNAQKSNISDTSLNQKSEQKFDALLLYKNYSREELKQKINNRVEEMFNEGIVEEVKSVLEKGFSKDSFALKGIGYREIIEFLDGKLTLDEVKSRIKISHWQYARRQITWFEGKGRGYSLTRVDNFEDSINSAKTFLSTKIKAPSTK